MRKSSNKQTARPKFRPRNNERNWGGDGTLVCPDSVRVLLPFTQKLTPGTTSGGLYVYQYRGNSCFDPDYTGTGLQPNGFDQWSQFYNTFVVLSSEIVVEFVSGTAATVEMVVVPAFNAASPASTTEAAGWRYAKTYTSAPTGNAAYKKVVSKMSTAVICGVPEAEVSNDSDFSSTVSTNPGTNQTWYWDIFLQALNASTTLADTLRVTIVYDVRFMAPVQQALSASRRIVVRNDDACLCAACQAKPTLRGPPGCLANTKL